VKYYLNFKEKSRGGRIMSEQEKNGKELQKKEEKKEQIGNKADKKFTKNEMLQMIKNSQEEIQRLEDELTQTQRIVQEKEALAKDYLDHLKRLQADFENYKKREEKRRKEFLEFANQELLSKLLVVVDNLERAIESSQNTTNVEAIKEGIDKILKEFHQILNQEGVKPINSIGNKFNPFQHEAMSVVETDQFPEDTITEELRKGYYFKSKVLRPAMVKVAVSVKKEKK